MPSNQHGPYYPEGSSGGDINSPNKKVESKHERDESGPEHLQSRTMEKEEFDFLISTSPKEQGKISIIMPTFKRQHTINRTIDSIISQTYTNWELILVDNEKEHAPYKFKDKRIRYFSHTDTTSAAYARNKGVEYITGEFVCFFDDDDTMDKEYLRSMVAPFSNPETKITHCEVWLVENRLDKSFCTPSSMVRRELITPTWQNNNPGHDQAYWLAILKRVQPHSLVGIRACLVFCGTSSEGGMRGGGQL